VRAPKTLIRLHRSSFREGRAGLQPQVLLFARAKFLVAMTGTTVILLSPLVNHVYPNRILLRHPDSSRQIRTKIRTPLPPADRSAPATGSRGAAACAGTGSQSKTILRVCRATTSEDCWSEGMAMAPSSRTSSRRAAQGPSARPGFSERRFGWRSCQPVDCVGGDVHKLSD